MLEKIQTLKMAVLALEQAVRDNDGAGFNHQLQVIRDTCGDLRIVAQPPEKPQQGSLNYKTINTIPFLMKPVLRENLFEGTYLEAFSEERTEQLMQAKAINSHNEFWKLHETLRGNVYGAVPQELVEEEAVAALHHYGWETVSVDILDFGRNRADQRAVAEYCEKTFDYYILVKEGSTNTVLALVFNV